MNGIILKGDVLKTIKQIPDNYIHTTVTSPPYYGLRNYGIEGQIGLEPTPEEFVAKMVEVFREVRRITNPSGTLWLNLGDSYWGSGKTTGTKEFKDGVSDIQKAGRAWKDLPDLPNPSLKKHPFLKPKDLIMIPFQVAIALRNDGWYLRSVIPWVKRNCMPESVSDRPTNAVEYVFLFTKEQKYYYDHEAIKVDSKDKESFTGRKKRSPDMRDTGLAQQNFHKTCQKTYPQRNFRNSDPFFESWQGLYEEDYNPLALVVNPKSFREAHFATFPPKLVEPMIQAGCPINEIAFDPFFGAGTVGLVAKRLGRKYLGIELNPDYIKIAEARIAKG